MYDGADDISVGTVNATTNQFGASNAASTGSTIAMSAAINEAGATVASAGTTDIGAAAGNYVSVTGTATITALGTVQTGTRRTVRFADTLTLTHNGTSLILPGAANITTAAGDVAVFVSLGSGNWFCAGYVRAASTVTLLTAGTAANNLVQLDGSAKLPAVDGSALTNLPGGGGGSWVLIQTQTASSSATIDFTSGITSTYDAFAVVLSGVVPATDAVNILMLSSANSGSTWRGSGNYAWNSTMTRGVDHKYLAGTSGQTSFQLNGGYTTNGKLSNSVEYAFDAVMFLHDLASATKYAKYMIDATYYDNGADYSWRVAGAGLFFHTSATNGLRFQMSSGNIASGTFSLYGIKKA
jgi:hypothetical protein